MALNPITLPERVVDDFLRDQLKTYPLADEGLYQQLRGPAAQAFCDQHDGDGWMLPETLCLIELCLTRTVDTGNYDERTRAPQPARSQLGERFLDWQLAQTPEESWAECERHAKSIRDGMLALAPDASHLGRPCLRLRKYNSSTNRCRSH